MSSSEKSYPVVFSQRFQTFARWVVVVILWLIIGSIAIGKAGISNYMELIHKRDVLKQTLKELEIQNQMIEEKIKRLKTSPDTQMHYLKENFGYVEHDEYVFQFHTKPSFSFGLPPSQKKELLPAPTKTKAHP